VIEKSRILDLIVKTITGFISDNFSDTEQRESTGYQCKLSPETEIVYSEASLQEIQCAKVCTIN
jgi:hypothetical protein